MKLISKSQKFIQLLGLIVLVQHQTWAENVKETTKMFENSQKTIFDWEKICNNNNYDNNDNNDINNNNNDNINNNNNDNDIENNNNDNEHDN